MPLIVDTHPHPIASDLTRYPPAPLGGRQSEWSKSAHNTAEEFLQHMDVAGVDRAALVQASTFHGYDNSYCADSAQRYPARFAGVSCVDPLSPDAPETLAYWISARGMRGVRLFTTGSTLAESHWLDSPATYPFWKEAKHLGIAVDVQVRFTGIPMFRRIAERFHDIPMILDHLAHPPIEDGPPYEPARPFFELAELPNVYLKFSTNNIKMAEQAPGGVEAFFQQMVDSFGPRRMLWGSNYPGTHGSPEAPYKELVDYARQQLAFLSERERGWLMGETANTLFFNSRAQGCP